MSLAGEKYFVVAEIARLPSEFHAVYRLSWPPFRNCQNNNLITIRNNNSRIPTHNIPTWTIGTIFDVFFGHKSWRNKKVRKHISIHTYIKLSGTWWLSRVPIVCVPLGRRTKQWLIRYPARQHRPAVAAPRRTVGSSSFTSCTCNYDIYSLAMGGKWIISTPSRSSWFH